MAFLYEHSIRPNGKPRVKITEEITRASTTVNLEPGSTQAIMDANAALLVAAEAGLLVGMADDDKAEERRRRRAERREDRSTERAFKLIRRLCNQLGIDPDDIE